MTDASIFGRKEEHIQHGLCEHGQAQGVTTGFDDFWLPNDALPNLALAEVDLRTSFLGFELGAPLLISSMTGGPTRGALINRNLALAAEALRIPMGVGSQRVALEDERAVASFRVARDVAPSAVLFANFGAVQLNRGYGADQARRAVEMIGANGLFLHLNALQEAVQPEGDTDFRGLLDKIADLVRVCDFPILVKECGAGISAQRVQDLLAIGVAAIDVSGAGGTSWAAIEGLRAKEPARKRLGEVFRDFGIPTTLALIEARRASPEAKLIASGGVRNGLDVAKAISLGADLVGVAKSVLAEAIESPEAVMTELRQVLLELRVACFVTGSANMHALLGKARRRDSI